MSVDLSTSKYTGNYRRFEFLENVARTERENILRVNVMPSARWPALLLFFDFCCFGVLCWAFSDILLHMFALKHAERWLATSSVSASLAMMLVTIFVRIVYVHQSRQSSHTKLVTWHLQQMVRTLLVVPITLLAALAWLSYRVQWNSPSSLALLAVLFVAKQLNVYTAYKHHKIVKGHLFALRYGGNIVSQMERREEPSRFEYPTVPIVEEYLAPATNYSAASMLLDETSGVETFHFKRTEASAPPVSTKPKKKNGSMSLKGAKKYKRNAVEESIGTSLNSVELSDDMVDYPYE